MSLKGANFQLSATNAGQAAFNQFNAGLAGIRRNVQSTRRVMGSFGAGVDSNRRGIQQLGFQVGDFATQIAGGQNAMLAFVQQGGQMLQFFGAGGAVLGAFLAVFGFLFIAFTKTGAAIDQLYPYLDTLEEEFRGLVDAMNLVAGYAADFGRYLIANLDQVIITVLVAAGYFGGVWVASMIAATAATFTFSGALAFMSAALLRTGIGAAIVLAGYLIERFLTLVRGAGSFGEALALVGDVAAEMGQRVVYVFQAIGLAAQATFSSIMSYATTAFNYLQRKAYEAGRKVSEILAEVAGAIDPNKTAADFLANIPTVDEVLGDQANDYAIEAEMAWENVGLRLDRATDALQSWKNLKDAIAAGESNVSGITGLGGAGAADTGGGGSAASDAVAEATDTAKQIQTTFENLQKSISSSMLGAFKSLTNGSKSFADAALDMLSAVADKIIDILMTPIFDNIAGSLAGSMLGGLGGLGASFEGGGFTGGGPRAGGLDGKGGYMAMVHPNETVVDHTKGQGMGGNVTNVTMNIQTPDAESFRKSKGQIQSEFARMVQQGSRGN